LAAVAGLAVAIVSAALAAGGHLPSVERTVFRTINRWPEWVYPGAWSLQLSGVIGVLPLAGVVAALLRRLRLSVTLLAATPLKVSLEALAKKVVQRHRPGGTLPNVILHGRAPGGSLGFPSGHAIVIFAVANLVALYLKGWWRILPCRDGSCRGVPQYPHRRMLSGFSSPSSGRSPLAAVQVRGRAPEETVWPRAERRPLVRGRRSGAPLLRLLRRPLLLQVQLRLLLGVGPTLVLRPHRQPPLQDGLFGSSPSTRGARRGFRMSGRLYPLSPDRGR
jgi:hypothetical protein